MAMIFDNLAAETAKKKLEGAPAAFVSSQECGIRKCKVWKVGKLVIYIKSASQSLRNNQE